MEVGRNDEIIIWCCWWYCGDLIGLIGFIGLLVSEESFFFQEQIYFLMKILLFPFYLRCTGFEHE